MFRQIQAQVQLPKQIECSRYVIILQKCIITVSQYMLTYDYSCVIFVFMGDTPMFFDMRALEHLQYVSLSLLSRERPKANSLFFPLRD